MKNLVDDLVVTCDEIEDTSESGVINPSYGKKYWPIAGALLTIACLLLQVIIVKYYMKLELTIPCLLLY